MSNNKHAITVRAIEPSDNRRAGSTLQSTHLAQVPVDSDPQLVSEYREAFLLIYKVRGQMKGLAVESNRIETFLDGEVQEEQTAIQWTESQMIEEQAIATPAAPPMAEAVPPPRTFTDLARRFSEQMQEVAATGRQITAASRQMASGIQDLNDGVGMLKRKLSGVKY